MSQRLYMDMHVPLVITEGLRRHGIAVLTSQDDGTDRSHDDWILQRATELGRVLFSQDADLLAIASDRQSLGSDFAGLIFAHQLRMGIGEVIEDLELLCTSFTAEEIRNRVVFLPLR